jgi:hypothetical protein
VLNTYLQRTQNLLQNPAAPTSLYATSDLTNYINIARGQLAGESKCIRAIGTISTVANQRNYNFSSVTVASPAGIQGIINIRSIQFGIASGQKWVNARGWTWFNYYNLNNPVPASGQPVEWAQLGQGVSGTFYLDPIPDTVYPLFCDGIWYPVTLVDDTTPEAIPYLWTDAVPYYAAYLAYLSAQSPARQNDAARMFEHYTTFVERARTASTPDVNRTMYPEQRDPAQLAKLGLSPKQSAAGGGGQ